MIEYIKSDLKLLKETEEHNGVFIGKERLFELDILTTTEDKIAFVDLYTDGLLSYFLQKHKEYLIALSSFKRGKFGKVLDSEIKKWLKKNDEKGLFLSRTYSLYQDLGDCTIAHTSLNISSSIVKRFKAYQSIPNECFHNLLKRLVEEEKMYFRQTDRRAILLEKITKKDLPYMFDGLVFISDDKMGTECYWEEDKKERRLLTLEELEFLSAQFDKIDIYHKELEKVTQKKFNSNNEI